MEKARGEPRDGPALCRESVCGPQHREGQPRQGQGRTRRPGRPGQLEFEGRVLERRKPQRGKENEGKRGEVQRSSGV